MSSVNISQRLIDLNEEINSYLYEFRESEYDCRYCGRTDCCGVCKE